jgi:hypothetical protein
MVSNRRTGFRHPDLAHGARQPLRKIFRLLSPRYWRRFS